jgi:excisionase family DNA binding protein
MRAAAAGRVVMFRLPPPNRIKTHRVYTVWEAAGTLGRHRRTVTRWIKSGALAADCTQKPWLIRGSDLKTFLEERRQSRKQKLALHHLYCLGCKGPQEPAGQMADYAQQRASTGMLSAICPDCSCMMHKIIRRSDLEAIRSRIEVSLSQADPRIVSRSDPPLNVTFAQERESHAKAQLK